MAEKNIWRGRGSLGHGKKAVYTDDEIPEAIIKEMDADHIKKLRRLGKIRGTTSAEEQSAIRKKAAANHDKADRAKVNKP